jgi:hypothetical protein
MSAKTQNQESIRTMNFTPRQTVAKSAALLALLALNAAAGTLYVDLNNPNPVSPYSDWSTAATNIQDAVDAAGTGDLILVNDGVYQAGGRVVYGALTNRVAVTRPVTVQSVNGPGVTVIQGYQVPGTTNGDAAVRCVYLTNGAWLVGFTLTKGATRNAGDTLRELSGGGVWCETNAIVSNCVLTGNRVNQYGGGAFSGTLNNCLLTNNSASCGGGAYYGALNYCTLMGNSAFSGGASHSGILNNCLVTDNSAAFSGGGTIGATLTNCTVSGNLAEYAGGGVSGGTLSACTLKGNSASAAGGGASSAMLSYCVVSSNSATGSTGRGGGVDSCTLNNCTVEGNSAYQGGGASGGTLMNCMLAHNSALDRGGGVISSTVYNSALWDNSARSQGGGADGGDLYNCTITGNSAPGGSGGGTSLSWAYNCIIYYNWAPTQPNYLSGVQSSCCSTPLPLGGANIAADPQLASVSHLSALSPCRGAGIGYARGMDIDGEPWANPPSIGCDDYGAGAVTAPLSVSIEADCTNLFPGMTAMFTGNNQGGVTATRWEFDDGTIVSNQPYASHSWSETGSHPVVLRAFNESHLAGVTATVMVQVGDTPTHYVALGSPTPQAPYTSWSTAATNIQDAIDAAGSAGEQILVSNGVYQLGGRTVPGLVPTSISNRVVVPRPLLVQSVNGPAVTVIQGFPILGGSAVRCVYLSGRAWLVGFTLTNGGTGLAADAPEGNGGGVWCQPGAVISNCVVVGNSAYSAGGGAYGGILNNCTLTGNSATNGGGAYGGTLNNCTLVGNSARFTVMSGWGLLGGGGGAGSCVLNNCIIMSNSATGIASFPFSGGGACLCTLNNCTLSGNSAAKYGGGAYSSALNNCLVMGNFALGSWSSSGGGAYSGTLTNTILTNNAAMGYGGGACSSTLDSCTLINNSVLSTSTGSGGGAYSSWLNKCLIISNTALGSSSSGGGAYSGSLRNCTLTGNSAASGGGGAFAGMFNCLITSNSAAGKSAHGGGAFWCELTNCTLVGNSATSGGGGSGFSTLNNCIVYYNSAPGSANYSNTVFSYCCTSPLPGGLGNFSSEPLFNDCTAGNLRLQANSPCINAGLNMYALSSTDLDGNPRISGGTVDVGAYEFQNPASILSYAWLQQYGLPMDGTADTADSDRDGLNNWQEWRAGTDPTNALSVLQLLSPTNGFSGLTVTWQSVTNRSYYLQRSLDLSAQPPFVGVQSNIVGQAGTTRYTDTNAAGAGPFFYRVGVQ